MAAVRDNHHIIVTVAAAHDKCIPSTNSKAINVFIRTQPWSVDHKYKVGSPLHIYVAIIYIILISSCIQHEGQIKGAYLT